MGPWCQKQHGKVSPALSHMLCEALLIDIVLSIVRQSGLSEACLRSPHTLAEVDQKIRRYLEHHLPGLEGKAVLAGNSVYADKMFLDKDLPLVSQYLHYRLVDVSSIKELARRWEPKLVELAKPASIPSKHRALDDIRDSISGMSCNILLVIFDGD
ncbi:hypothetical protein PtB15_11B360 [Puccinia triticina]|nr:hypothetical protein PtB15_11B360 [Puccinia triticina]